MKKRNYWIARSENFANAYKLRWSYADDDVDRTIYEPISCRDARYLCGRERERRTYNPSSANFADAFIWPINADVFEIADAESLMYQCLLRPVDGYVVDFNTDHKGEW